MTLIKIQKLSHTYDGTPVLRDIDLEIKKGEILGIIGPSGVGKTTLLRLINGLEKLQSGRILFDGQELNGEKTVENRRRMAMMFQDTVLLNETVLENVTYGLRLRMSSQDVLRYRVGSLFGRSYKVEERAREALRLVGLDGKEDRLARTLSGGEAQRVAFARALAVEPEVLLLDEPTANLDPRNVALIEEVIRGACGGGVTVVLATHNMYQVRRLAHRVALLLDGRIVDVCDNHAFFESSRSGRRREFVDGTLIY